MSGPVLPSIPGIANVSTLVIQGIVKMIVSGDLKPGDSLPSESAISKQMGVGMSSVREALATLQGLGVIAVRHGAGRQVRGLTFSAIADARISPVVLDGSMAMNVWEVRLAVETASIRLAAERATEADIKNIEAAAQAMADAVAAGGRGVDEDGLIHRAIAEASGNQLFVWLGDSVASIIAETRATGLSHEGRPARAVSDHFELLEAIRHHDPDEAEAALRRHLDFQYHDALELLPPQQRREREARENDHA
ncbi:FadR/GntR family transcriptional regulator [Microbacterium sediminicola]|uniref:FadR/GntR family transcriptional regulator n=1 Tax=Microbacterium sediminicola TaxID=415210 RepID=A0ABP4ULK0_9MICO